MPQTAMVFAAGLGTRMRPITETLPKPLIHIGGRTMLDHMLDRLHEAGVARAVVNVHYHADQIEAALGEREQPAVVVSDERDALLDQAGGIIKALHALGTGPFFICNTDAVWLERSPALPALAAAWDGERMDVLLLVAPTDGSIGVDWDGDFALVGNGRLVRRAGGRVPFVYAGVGIIKASLFADVGPDIRKLAPFFFAAAEQGRLFGVSLDGLWLHVGTPQAVTEAEAAFTAHAAGR